MKFFSWNVNGFRSVLKKGFMDWLEAAEPDVLSLQTEVSPGGSLGNSQQAFLGGTEPGAAPPHTQAARFRIQWPPVAQRRQAAEASGDRGSLQAAPNVRKGGIREDLVLEAEDRGPHFTRNPG